MKEYGLRRFALCARATRGLRRPSLDARTLRAELPQPIVLVVGEKEGIIRRAQWGTIQPMTLGDRGGEWCSLDVRTLTTQGPLATVR